MKNFEIPQIPNEEILLPELKEFGVRVFLKREDKIHPVISGNKYRKLKYNLLEASRLKHTTLLTFGGAFSNHIAAVAQAGETFGFKTIGVIRGDELQSKVIKNPTLAFARSKGMTFDFVSREEYRRKKDMAYLTMLRSKYGEFYHLPEGGTNELAIKGCEEILEETDKSFHYVCCSVGTSGTMAGLINAVDESQQVLGFPALKGDFLTKEICKFVKKENWTLINQYSFGGYARVSIELIDFINDFYKITGIPLDPIYTGKMMFGIRDLIMKSYFKRGTKILCIHTGGLQGVAGMNEKLKNKNLPLICIS